MEGLIILVGEFLLAPIIIGVSTLVQVIVSFCSLVLELLFGIKLEPKSDKPRKPIKIHPKLLKWFRRITLGTLSISLSAIALVNFVFLEQTVRFVADTVEAKTGIEIEYTSMEGNLFTGYFAFSGLKLDQSTAEKPQFHVEANFVEADLPILSLIMGKREVEKLTLADASIEYVLAKTAADTKVEQPSGIKIDVGIGGSGGNGVNVSTRPNLLNSPRYTVRDLRVERVAIHVVDASSDQPTDYDINIDQLHVAPLRSHYAVFDLLFRTNLNATLNGSRLEIINTETNGMRRTKWATHDVQAEILASFVGGPFALFDGGLVNVEVDDEWEVEQIENLSLDWKIRVADAKARLPDSTPTALKPLAQIWVNNINESSKEWEFGFELELSESRFHGASSLNAKQIWEGSIPVILKQVADYTGFEESAIKDTTGKTFDRFKSFLKERNEAKK
ncbi:MAG: hypothetical protein ACSHYA_18965 [Opitutaceae bacterium]